MTTLSPRAERFIQKLGEALRPIDRRNREAILLELRSHLHDCSTAGARRLDQALDNMGEPEEFAKGFIAIGGTGLPPASNALVVASAAPAPSPASRPDLRSLVRELKATFEAAHFGLWRVGLVLVCGLTVTNFLGFAQSGSGTAVSIALVRFALLVLATVAGYRLFLRSNQPPWKPNLATAKFAGGMAMILLSILALLIGVRLASTAVAGDARLWLPLVTGLAIASSAIAALRLQPWLVALAIARGSEVGATHAWRRMAGKTTSAVKLWLVLVLPLFVAHFGLTFLGRSVGSDPSLLLGVAGLDALLASAMALVAIAINAMTFRWVAGEPVPEPEIYSTLIPSAEEIERQRALLLHHLRESQRLA